MTTLAPPPPSKLIDELDHQYILLEGMSWGFYKRVLNELGERPIRVTFDEGSIELMVPLPEHEQFKELIGRLLEMLAYELDLPLMSIGSTTLRRDDLEKGLEADTAYYLRNEPKIRGKRKLNLKKEPPPDLVLEVDITYHALNREKIYAAMGVPEIWQFDGKRLECLHLQRGRYVSRTRSLSIPWLAVAEVERFTKMLWSVDQTSIVRQFGQWVRKHGPQKK